MSRCKSRLSALARCFFLGRAHWRSKFEELEQAFDEILEKSASVEAARQQAEEENAQLRQRVAELEAQAAKPQPLSLPVGNPPPGLQFGEGLIALCVNMARCIGLRPTVRALRIFFQWLKVRGKLPTYQTIISWMQRLGLDRMRRPNKRKQRMWLADHTIQMGKSKALVVLGAPLSTTSAPDLPLRHEQLEVLTLTAGEQWQREQVGRVYQQIAERCGQPRAIGVDGAVELREPAETLGKPGERPLVIRDPKHFLANKFEALLKRGSYFEEFTKQLGRSRSALQQTELAAFVPPPFKPKARFMNLASMLNWASAVLYHLAHPNSLSRQAVTAERMEEKLGWLKDFAPHIKSWQACQEVISVALEFVNGQGLYRGAADQLEKQFAQMADEPLSQQLAASFLTFLRQYETHLGPQERLPMSTEILESSFALFKQLEKQHSKSGFTGLLLAYPTLLRETTAKEIRASFGRIKVADVKQWIKKNLPETYASKRQLMYRESNPESPKRATPKLQPT
jgi:hypothetical protein